MTAVDHPDLVTAIILAAAGASENDIPPGVGKTPFIAGDTSATEQQRLDALRLGFFAPGHDPRPWLDGWYPQTLAMERAALTAVDQNDWWAGGSVPLLEIIPAADRFKPEHTWRQLRDQLGSRVETVIIDDAAHALFPEQPGKVAAAVLPWAADFSAPA